VTRWPRRWIATFYEPADPNYGRQRLFELMWQQAL
jgi:hypothetical protein